MPSNARNAPSSNTNASELGAADFSRGVSLVALILLGAAAVILTASAGGPHRAFDALLAVVGTLIDSSPALALVAASIGLGRLARPLFRESADSLALQVAVGLSIMLTLTHALGVSGIMGSALGRLVALAVCVLGLGIGGHQFAAHLNAARNAPDRARDTAAERWRTVLWLALLPALGVIITAACNPPGWLWASEFGGFDALSYHLQLPREWLAAGRVWPVEHNVYSYLPGFMESAFAFLGWMRGLGGPHQPPGPDSAWLVSCQILHAALTLAAAWLTARAAARLLDRGDNSPALAPMLAGGLTLVTPWIVVVGSLAYNEMPMVALFAGAMLTSMETRIPAFRRGILAGWLVGVACGIKPTALLFAGLPVGAVLIFTAPRREWLALFSATIIAGLAALAPWLARNAIACGNPVFPYASSIFGLSHWTPEQFARFASGHHFNGTLLDRLRLLVLAAPNEPGTSSTQRGMMHAQWGVFFPLTALAVVATLFHRSRLTLAITLGLALQTAAWLFTTHLQSRFLIPLIVPATMLIAATAESLRSRGNAARHLASSLALLVLAIQSGVTTWIFVTEQRWKPNALLIPGPGILSGEPWAAQLESLTPEQLNAALQQASPEMWINLSLPRDATIYLLGDSTPLYIDRPVLYHTTWDTSTLGVEIRADPTSPTSWSEAMAARGVAYVLFNLAEINRLQRSGWYDPEVTTQRAEQLLQTQATLMHSWPEQSRSLYRLDPAAHPGAEK